MTPSIANLRRAQHRRLQRVVQKSRDKEHARRALAILHLAEGMTVKEVAARLCAARSTVHRWRDAFLTRGESGLESQRRGREVRTLTGEVVELVRELLRTKPQKLGYLRSRWRSELLAQVVEERLSARHTA